MAGQQFRKSLNKNPRPRDRTHRRAARPPSARRRGRSSARCRCVPGGLWARPVPKNSAIKEPRRRYVVIFRTSVLPTRTPGSPSPHPPRELPFGRPTVNIIISLSFYAVCVCVWIRTPAMYFNRHISFVYDNCPGRGTAVPARAEIKSFPER